MFKQLKREVHAIGDAGVDLAKIPIPAEPDSFYADFGCLSHPRTGKPVPHLAPYQIQTWKALLECGRVLVIKSNKIGLSTSTLMADFQLAVLPSSSPRSCRGYDQLLIAQTIQHAREHLYTLRKLILGSQKYRPWLITRSRDMVLKDEATKVTVLYIRNPENENRPSRIIGLGLNNAGSVLSWKNVKHIHVSDPTAAEGDYTHAINAGMTRLANTSGSMIIETVPAGPRGRIYELFQQFKAHAKPIGPQNLTDFFGKVSVKRSKNPNVKGIFASLSGFSANALEMYDEFTAQDKLVYTLLDNGQIQDLLIKSGLLISDQKIDSKIKSNTTFNLGERYLLYTEWGIFIVQILLVGGKPSHYLILTGTGELVHKTIEDEIAKLDKTIKSLVKIDLQILDSVTINLLDLKKKSIPQISREINQTENDVSIAIEELRLSNLVNEEQSGAEKLFSMKTDMESLSKLASKYALSSRKYDFMSSSYIENTINDTFASYVKDRFKLSLDRDKTNMLIAVCRIFPSILHHMLLGDNSLYIRNYQHIEELRKSGQELGHLANIMESPFFDRIVTSIRSDMQTLDSNYLAKKKGIQGFHMKSVFKMASETRLIFSIYTEGINFFATAGGPIQAGSFISARDIGLFLSLANTYCSLELYDEAITEFNKVIELAKDKPDLLKIAWNNKGLCYHAQKKCDEAIKCYLEALKIDGNLIQAINNLVVCYDELNDDVKANEFKERLAKLRDQK